MGLLGEDQPDPDGSSGSQAIKSLITWAASGSMPGFV
jgi:hypothetical protein